MQTTKTYSSKFFRGEARDQLEKDVKKMAKAGWRVHTGWRVLEERYPNGRVRI